MTPWMIFLAFLQLIYHPNEAIDLWCNDKVRHPNQNARKQYKKHKKSSNLLDFWDNWIDPEPQSDSDLPSDHDSDLDD